MLLLQPTHHCPLSSPLVERTCLRNCRMSCHVLPMGSAGVNSWTARIVDPMPAARSAAEIDTADPIATKNESDVELREQLLDLSGPKSEMRGPS